MSISPTNQNDANSSGGAPRSQDTLLFGDPQQIKYKKAVREISKLINLVKSLKAQITDLEYDLQETQIKNQHLQRRIRQVENLKSMQSQSDNKKSLADPDEKGEQQKEYRETRAFQLEEAIVEKQRIIEELQTLLDTKRTQNIQLYHKCDRLEQELNEEKLRAQSSRFQREQLVQQQILQNQLKKSEEYIHILVQENNKLKEQEKMQIINSQFHPQPYWQQYPGLFGLRNRSQEKHGKGGRQQKLEDIKNEYKQKRQKYKKQIKQLQQSEKFYVQKYEQVTQFIEKQQKFIEKCILSPNLSTNFNNFNNYSAFTQNQSQYDVYRL